MATPSKPLQVAALWIIVIGVPVVGLLLVADLIGHVHLPPPPADSLSIILTALTVVLGFLALVVSGLAIWGYSAIKGLAEDTACKEVERHLTSRNFKEELQGMVDKAYLASAAETASSNTLAILSGETSEAKSIAQAYPRSEGG